MKRSVTPGIVLALVLMFFYVPIMVLVVVMLTCSMVRLLLSAPL